MPKPLSQPRIDYNKKMLLNRNRFSPEVLPLMLVFLGMLSLLVPTSGSAETGASTLPEVQVVKDQWEQIFFGHPPAQQLPELMALVPKADALIAQFPYSADPLILKALMNCSLAANEGGFGALGRLRDTKGILEKALAINPQAMQGSGYVILGNLYFRLPGWPLSYGDDELARRNLEMGLRLYPDNLDTNYYYGDFLMEQGEYALALRYFEHAEKAEVRADSNLSDRKLKAELVDALKDARNGNMGRSSFFSRFLKTIGN